MAWARRWRIDGPAKWRAIVRALLESPGIEFPCELVVRSEHVDKTPAQRKLFHAICADLAPHMGLTPEGVKDRVKQEYFGAEVHVARGALTEDEALEFQRLLRKVGPYTVVVPSSEDLDREAYGTLIDFAYQFASEIGVYIPDRRTR